MTRAQGVDQVPKLPRSQTDNHLWNVQEQVESMETQQPNRQDPEDPLPIAQCQTPHGNPRSLLSLPRCVRAILVTQGEQVPSLCFFFFFNLFFYIYKQTGLKLQNSLF